MNIDGRPFAVHKGVLRDGTRFILVDEEGILPGEGESYWDYCLRWCRKGQGEDSPTGSNRKAKHFTRNGHFIARIGHSEKVARIKDEHGKDAR